MPDEQIEYESPSTEERRAMDHGETMPGVSVIHAPRLELDDGPLPPKEEAMRRLAEREVRQKQREDETLRTTSLHLAVEWTATADEVPLGAVFGIADLMAQYIQTGKKPTEHEFSRAVKPYRR